MHMKLAGATLAAMILIGGIPEARAERYVVKPNAEGGFIELSDKTANEPELLEIVPECKDTHLAKSYAPNRMNLYGCWWKGNAGMITVRWFDPYKGPVLYTYDPKDFRVLRK